MHKKEGRSRRAAGGNMQVGTGAATTRHGGWLPQPLQTSRTASTSTLGGFQRHRRMQRSDLIKFTFSKLPLSAG